MTEEILGNESPQSVELLHGGDLVAAVLEHRGVRQVYTLIGGHVSPILVGCKRRGIRVIDVRHEVNTVFAADASARLTGVPGAAVVTAGPGVTNTVTAIKNAQMAPSPLVLFGGAAATVLKGRGSLQDIDQLSLMRSVVKASYRVTRVRDLVPVIERAFDQAQSGVPGPVFVECPIDVLYPESNAREMYMSKSQGKSLADRALKFYLTRHLNQLFKGSQRLRLAVPNVVAPKRPAGGKLDKIARALRGAKRPLLLVGSQAVLNTKRVNDTAVAIDRLGIPFYLAGAARGLLGPGHPLQARHKRRDSIKRADLVLLAGVSCDFRLDYGRQIRSKSTLVSVNRSAIELRLNRRPTIGVVGDPGEFLRNLSMRVSALAPQEWRDEVTERDAVRELDIERRAQVAGPSINPLSLCKQIEAQLPSNAILVVDGGDFVATAAYICRPRAPLAWLDPGAFGTLGVGAGFALGAKMARPDSEVWILYGDGSVGFSIAEFDTFVRHQIPVIAVVGNDACWTQIVRDQVVILKDDVACQLAHTPYHQVAEGFGAIGLEVNTPDEVEGALRQARAAHAAGKTVLINARIDASDFRKGSISV